MSTRDIISLVAIVLVGLLTATSLKRYTKREEFRELMESGQKINLNLMTFLMAFMRKKSDPLRDDHIRIAKIGLFHFVAMIIIMVIVLLVIGISSYFVKSKLLI